MLTSEITDRIHVDPESGCWVWTGGHGKLGYGQCRVGGRVVYVHRLVYEATHGQVPDGLQLDHLCRVRECCNPQHLEPVSRHTNILRGSSPSAGHARQTHCIHGHEFTAENTYRIPTRPNTRICLACKRERDRARR